MADHKTALALGSAAAIFAGGAIVAVGLSPGETSPGESGSVRVDASLPPIGGYANDWHLQTAIASYESRLLRYAQRDANYTATRFAFRTRVFVLYGAGRPSNVVRNLLRSAPRTVVVRWVRVPYSLVELDRARRRIADAMPRNSVIEYAPNYSGILVGLHPLPRSPGAQEHLYAQAQRVTDIPVTFLEAGFANPM